MNSGLGIRSELFRDIELSKPDLGFLEAHSENYFGESLPRAKLRALRRDYPVSLHGVGLSLGRADALSKPHLAALKSLADEIEPMLVSEHLAWSAYLHRQVPDLLPLPLTEESLQVMCEHIDQLQSALNREILIENPANYLLFDLLQIPEAEFLNFLADRTGCGLLVDVNNVYVSARNVGRDPHSFIDALNTSAIKQYHLAGHVPISDANGEPVLIDTHNQPVSEETWSLFAHTLGRHGQRPTLIEWDSDFPTLDVLISQCDIANHYLGEVTPATVSNTTQHKPASLATESIDAISLTGLQDTFLDTIISSSPFSPKGNVDANFIHRAKVYQNNVKQAVSDYLAAVYPATRGVVGEDYFKQLAYYAMQASPPSDGNLHNYGADLATFLNDFSELADLPYLEDLMQFEWALHSLYYLPQISGLDPNDLDQATLLTIPVAIRDDVLLLASEYPIYQIHQQSLPDYDGDVSIRLDQGQDTLLVYKHEYTVQVWVLGSATTKLLLAIQESGNLLQAIEGLAGSLEAEQLSHALAQVLERMVLQRL